MKKLLSIVFIFVIASSLFSYIIVYLYDLKISGLIQSTDKEDIMKYQRLNDILLSPLIRLIIVTLCYDLITSCLYFGSKYNILKKLFKFSSNKIPVQAKSTGDHGNFLIDLMLSVFIKLFALAGINYFSWESNQQIDRIFSLYSDELNQTQKSHLDGLRTYIYMLIISCIVMTVLYVITFLLKYLDVHKNNRGIMVTNKGDDSSKLFNS